MPWYWSDDLAQVLVGAGKLEPEAVAGLSSAPVAYRSDSESAEDAAKELAEEGEIPLAA